METDLNINPISVVVADDHPLVVEGLQLSLEHYGMDVVGVAGDGIQALDMTISLEPDVLLLDINMPRMDGLQAVSAVKKARPETCVIMLTGEDSPYYLARSIALGAGGYLTKGITTKHLVEAIRTAVAGEAIVDRELLQAALRSTPSSRPDVPSETQRLFEDLTPQERRVLKLIVGGFTNEEIAQNLVVSRNTVKSHVSRIFSKLGVSDRTQAAIWALRSGQYD